MNNEGAKWRRREGEEGSRVLFIPARVARAASRRSRAAIDFLTDSRNRGIPNAELIRSSPLGLFPRRDAVRKVINKSNPVLRKCKPGLELNARPAASSSLCDRNASRLFIGHLLFAYLHCSLDVSARRRHQQCSPPSLPPSLFSSLICRCGLADSIDFFYLFFFFSSYFPVEEQTNRGALQPFTGETEVILCKF